MLGDHLGAMCVRIGSGELEEMPEGQESVKLDQKGLRG